MKVWILVYRYHGDTGYEIRTFRDGTEAKRQYQELKTRVRKYDQSQAEHGWKDFRFNYIKELGMKELTFF